MRGDIEIEFKNISSEAEQIAATACLTPSLPRIASRQAHRNNTPAATPEEYFRTTVSITYISLLDKIIMEMETRFNPFIVKSSKLLSLVPSIISNDDIPFDEKGFREILEFYSSDIPKSFLIEQELRLRKRKWDLVKEDAWPGNLAKTLKECDELTFPNLFVLIKIGATLPVTSCECELSFSVKRRLRAWLRACMISERLSALALIHIHYGHPVDYNRIIDISKVAS